jgi:hypothetical protein
MGTLALRCMGEVYNGFTIVADGLREVGHGTVAGLNKIKSDMNGLCDALNGFSAFGHLCQWNSVGANNLYSMAESFTNVVDILSFPVTVIELGKSTYKWVAEPDVDPSDTWRKRIDVLSKLSFAAATALSSMAWLGARGIVELGKIASSTVTAFQVFGTPLLVSASSCISFLFAAGFAGIAAKAYRDIAESGQKGMNDEQKWVYRVHRCLVIARCVTQIAASALFIVATAIATTSAGVAIAASMAPWMIGLGAFAFTLGVIELLYRSGRQNVLDQK